MELNIQPSETALLIIDMQVDFCSPDGLSGKNWGSLNQIQSIIPTLKDFHKQLKKLSVLTVFTRFISSEKNTPKNFSQLMALNELSPICIAGTQGAEIFELQPEADDTIIDKYVYDCYSGTNLLQLFKQRGIKIVLITGVRTDVCVDATAKRTLSENMVPIIIEDLVASTDERKNEHKTVLEIFQKYHGLVVPAQEMLKSLTKNVS